ncbi:MAG: hypothetical protein ACKVP4_10630 [Hyphomicrobium sp.]
MDWPRYMVEKRLSSGIIGYYWTPSATDYKAGFTMRAEPLGHDFADAKARANHLNTYLDAWRAGRGAVKDLDLQPGLGTLEWMIETYKRSRAWAKVSARARPDYELAFRIVCTLPRKSGGDVGSAPLGKFDAAAVDRIYEKLQIGPRGKRLRQANICIQRLARAWDVVRRLKPKYVPEQNPFRDVELTHSCAKRPAATREQAIALHKALIVAGEPHLAAAPLICFEWLQRPENVIAGHLAWTDYRGSERPDAVRIVHHKTGQQVWMRLSDDGGPFFPELMNYLDSLPRLGVAVVLMAPKHGNTRTAPPARPYKIRDARARVRKAARNAKLPDWLTLDACRHGGMTELADSGLTEEQEMSLSGHTTPDAKRRYVAKTENRRLAAARLRREWVVSQERNASETRNGHRNANSE